MGQVLKVLNSVRFCEIGVPTIYLFPVSQESRVFAILLRAVHVGRCQYMFRVHLIARSVTSRNLHLLAIRISSYLSLKRVEILGRRKDCVLYFFHH